MNTAAHKISPDDTVLMHASDAGEYRQHIEDTAKNLKEEGRKDEAARLLRVSSRFRSGANMKFRNYWRIEVLLREALSPTVKNQFLKTFNTISAALDTARARSGEDCDLDVINDDEISDAFGVISDDDALEDVHQILFWGRTERNQIFNAMRDLDFYANSQKHFCLAVCLYGAMALRGSLFDY